MGASAGQSFDNSAVTILCVDDEANILSALKRLFRPIGYQVLTALSGADGLKVLEEKGVDLVISDMRMPEMDGAEFLERVATKWPGVVRILLTGHAELGSTIEAINKGRIYRYVSKPWEEMDLKLTIHSALEQRYLEQERRRLEKLTYIQNEELQELNSLLEDKVALRTQELAKANETLQQNHILTIKGYSNLIEAREPLLAGHSRRVADLSKRVAVKLGMNQQQVQDVTFAALLHDIGKIGLPDHLLTKPYDTLGSEHLERVRAHTVIAQGILMAMESLQEVGSIIRSHHERYDGTGYPDGLKAQGIPIAARIIAVVNDYDAVKIGTLTAEKLSEPKARRYVEERSGSWYDPNVVQQFFAVLNEIGEKDTNQQWTLQSHELEKGMVLAKDLVAKDGILLLSKGFVLDEKMIKKIQMFERLVDIMLKIEICAK